MHADFKVLFHENCILVLNKPANVPMDGDSTVTVEKWILQSGFIKEGNEAKEIKWVHQLDSPTSGILCVALTKRTASVIAHCFQTRTVYKEYTAMVYGHVEFAKKAGTENTSHILDAPLSDHSDENSLALPLHICVAIGEDSTNDFRMKAGGRNSKWSHTEILSCQIGYLPSCGVQPDSHEASDFSYGNCQDTNLDAKKRIPVTKISVRLHTGRRHQIRVHLAQVLCRPIINDSLYGPFLLNEKCSSRSAQSVPCLQRLMLHSTKLCFPLNFHDIDTFPSKATMRRRTRAYQKYYEEGKFTFSREPDHNEAGTIFSCPDEFPKISM